MTQAVSFNRAAANTAVVDAISSAASRTGVDFSYLLANARAESGLNPAARAATSSASGLFQFTDATWLATVARHGDQHGLAWAAEALKAGASGAVRQTILSLRHNAEMAATMAAEFTRDNAARLEGALGRTAGAADLYLAAFFGAGGAIRFLKTMAAAPGMAAASLLPAAAAANRSTFFAADGRARSLAEVHEIVAGRINRHLGDAPAAAGNSLPQAGSALPPADPALVAARARMAYLVLVALQ
ncbi:transglycosylase SLT domain-containing protein [Sandarakinorhabdus oryzae]|uniref:transglycosylase SLT domain-containing protein n=1 Tax=Sandarakinorhabdus oryzae TaxID=2675220 RepID=UPI0012E10722|nr:transglycosylase SLT domain-containing protein [Sandarakinorhabdus oryzae]